MIDYETFTKLPQNVGDLGKKALKTCPKSNKSPNLVTLTMSMKVDTFVDKI